MLRRGVVPCALLGGALIITSASCLGDLPEPKSCPPSAQVEAEGCVEALTAPPPGCFELERMQCLAGPRTSCTCVSSECPVEPDACFPAGDCPPRVREDAGPEASCLPLAPSDFGAGVPGEIMCLCGCPGCASVCDGVGPVMGLYSQAGDESPSYPFIAELGNALPDQGRLGFYLRARGLANFVIAIATGDVTQSDLVWVEPTYLVFTPFGTDFVEQVFFEDEGIGLIAYDWTTAADKPTLVALAPKLLSNDSEALALFEVDCLIPFVLPLP